MVRALPACGRRALERIGPRLAVMAAATLALMVALGALGAQGLPRMARRAVVTMSERGLMARPAAAAGPAEATPGARLREGTDLHATAGTATVTLFEGSSLVLAAEAEVRLTVLRSGPLGRPCQVAIEQRQGRATYHAAGLCGGRSYVRVHLPGARVAGREARFTVGVDAAGNSDVEVHEGRVQIIAAGGGQYIAQAGDTVRVVEGVVLPILALP